MNSQSQTSPPSRPSRKKKSSGFDTFKSVMRNIGRVFVTLILVCIITGCIVASVLTVYVLKYINSDESVDLSRLQLDYTTIIYADNKETGQPVEVERLYGNVNRIWVDYDQIPKHMVNALISIEDKRFWDHQGVDWVRTAGAFVNLFVPIYDSKQGGSTITQQLIKNTTGDDDVRIERKVREIFSALALEKKYSKESILEAYLNTVTFGNNTHGVQAAANLYFNKDVSELSIAEAASIIGITQYPGAYDPFVNPDKNEKRRNDVLFAMFEQGKISEAEYNQAINTKLTFERKVDTNKASKYQTYFVDSLRDEVLNDLVEIKGYEKNYALDQLLNGGLRIYSTMDKEMQDYLEKIYLEKSTFPQIKNEVLPESAFVITDTHGKIVAMVGSNRPKEGDQVFNRATQAKRQVGSSIKPISSYALAFENDMITWSTVMEDEQITVQVGNGQTWTPKNEYNSFKGPVTICYALARSINIIPVKLTMALSPKMLYHYLKDSLGLYNLTENDIAYSPMALGSLSSGVTPLEMAGAYQIFANGGTFTKPYSYTKVLDSQGNTILEKDTTAKRVMTFETATVLNRLLQYVTSDVGTGFNARLANMPTGGKTGTTDNSYNQWFIGFTPYYVGAVWLGYDIPETVYYGYYPPPMIWKNVMAPIHEGLATKDFEYSNNVVSKTYCTKTGLLASDYCEGKLNGWYKTSNIPDVCTECEFGGSSNGDEPEDYIPPDED